VDRVTLSLPVQTLVDHAAHLAQQCKTAHTHGMFRFPLVFLTYALITWAPVAAPDQTDTRLDMLFERLRTTTDGGEGQRITQEIWVIWRETDNDIADDLMDQGLRDMTRERYDEALAVLNKVVKAAPNYAEGWNARATLLYLMGDYPASAVDVRRTLALEPRHFGAWSGLGLIHMSLENDTAALEAFKQALTLNPHLSGSRRNIELIKKRLEEKII
jgi:tetratricopeptide (TPR) repeat protein